MKKTRETRGFVECGREDLNLQGVAPTRPSTLTGSGFYGVNCLEFENCRDLLHQLLHQLWKSCGPDTFAVLAQMLRRELSDREVESLRQRLKLAMQDNCV